jgi:hypothetical protein
VSMSPGLRKFALAVHLTLSDGWIGVVVAYLALDVTAATSRDAQTLRAAYIAMGRSPGSSSCRWRSPRCSPDSSCHLGPSGDCSGTTGS